MLIEYTPSEKSKAKIAYIKSLHESGLTYEKIAKQLGHTRIYIHALLQWDRENSKKEATS